MSYVAGHILHERLHAGFDRGRLIGGERVRGGVIVVKTAADAGDGQQQEYACSSAHRGSFSEAVKGPAQFTSYGSSCGGSYVGGRSKRRPYDPDASLCFAGNLFALRDSFAENAPARVR